MKLFFWAHFETRNFTFDAFGNTRREARAALRAGWATHQKQYHATLTWKELACDVTVQAVRPGQCLRDMEKL